MDQIWGRGNVGLTSLVSAGGTANIGDTLSNVPEKVILGVACLNFPLRTPGVIVVGRGQDIMGRLNLACFEDPLHPSADI